MKYRYNEYDYNEYECNEYDYNEYECNEYRTSCEKYKKKLEDLQFQLQQQQQKQQQLQTQLQQQQQNQAQNDTDVIENIGNPNISVNVGCCCDHKKDKRDDHNKDGCLDHKKDKRDGYNNDCCRNHKKHDDCCFDYRKRDNSCCRLERRVNNPANDVTNFPRITQSETSIAYFNNFILYGFNDRNDEVTRNSVSGFAFSNDFGKTWTDGGSVPANMNGFNGGDPVIAVDRNGVFYYGQIAFEVVGGVRQSVISVSTGTITPNETITMNAPQVVGRGANPNDGDFNQDKEWIAVGPDADKPGSEALYITWTDFTTPTPSIRFSKYRTGTTLQAIITDQVIVPPAANTFVSGSYVIVDKLGGIYVFYEQITDPNPGDGIPPRNNLNTPNRTIRMLKSTDGGNTFPINIAVSNPFAAAATDVGICGRPSIGVDNGRRIRMNDYAHAAIGPDGTIYAVWNEGRVVSGTTYIDVILAYSTDKGNTWNRINVTPDTRTFPFFPTVAANKLGAHVQYNRFNDRGGTLGGTGDGTFAIYLRSYSICDGLSKEEMISTVFSEVPVTNPSPEPNLAGCYMGDYNQIIAGPGNCLLHSWGDNRDVIIQGGIQRFNPDVFFAITVPDQKDHGCGCD